MAGILEGILEGDIFLGELTVEAGSVRMRGYCRRGCSGRHLLRWRAVVRVLQDSCWRLAYLIYRRGRSWGDCTFRSLGRRARGRMNARRFF
jgi:hypothetical protein